MLPSAILGLTPVSLNDKLVYKALKILSPTELTPDPLHPFGPGTPKNAPPGDRATGMIIGQSFAMFFVLAITSARFYIRASRGIFGLDDGAIIPAVIGFLAYMSFNIASETAGCLGSHIWTCTYSQIGWYAEFAQINIPLFYWTVYWAKIAIVLQNRRITGISSHKWQIAHYIYLGFLVPIAMATLFVNIFQCNPVATFFRIQAVAEMKDPRTIKCLNAHTISFASRSLHIITDWVLLPVPVIIIWRLQMPLEKKLRIIALFSFGAISSVASIIRNATLLKAGIDSTYDLYFVYAWNVVDIFFAVIVPSLPAINPLVDTLVDSVLSLTSNMRSRISGISSPTYRSHTHERLEGGNINAGPLSDQELARISPNISRQVDIEMHSEDAEDLDKMPINGWTTSEPLPKVKENTWMYKNSTTHAYSDSVGKK